MKDLLQVPLRLYSILIFTITLSCHENKTGPTKEIISQINLKRGTIISCGFIDRESASVRFEITCDNRSIQDFNLAVELLHSFEYDESEKLFAKIIDANPDCAMAYWGVAMCNFHALWTAPTEAELIKGSMAIQIAQAIPNTSERESAYIGAMATFYQGWEKIDHRTRCTRYEKAMEKIYQAYPADKEAAIFYALALDASADPSDKSFANQKKAGAILKGLYPSEPNHPGIIHYIIHTYDYPGLADSALLAAKAYAQVAPYSAHALHMPSHIFTRLGLWDECIKTNLASVAAAKCYAEQAGIKGHWDEELHGLDYLVYAYLQKGANKLAREQLIYLRTMKIVSPVNFKVAYAFAAIPARIYLENKNWAEAANLELIPADLPWQSFPWQSAIVHFTRLLGAAHLGKTYAAQAELIKLQQLRDTLLQQKDLYKSQQVAIQIKTGEAWIHFTSGMQQTGLEEMKAATEMEEATEKHPVTPGEVLPAMELLGDMFFELQQYDKSLQCYEKVLQKRPNRFNSLYGAGSSAKKNGDTIKASFYFTKLVAMCGILQADRPELATIRTSLKEW